ncbi:hypothetical protein SeLEV6574_g03316 [Synchytrium endobioticum]|uniref:N-acetylglucosaminylphosphatidylinositol deacetylase n=2 Tax=Synchytrium endobioticum TaxID=286115 RepID=A0A507D452_9FUNG|nr:hypothetical protein SeLEV6574_g03316 [Synchytrium endobioticum]
MHPLAHPDHHMPRQPDGAPWCPHRIATLLATHIGLHRCTAILSFDGHGVSGHHNHRALYHGVKLHVADTGVPAFALVSVPLWRKYIAHVDVCLLPAGAIAFVASPEHVRLAVRAMKEHRSQMVWFRWLYVWLSRYMVVNQFVRIGGGDGVVRRRALFSTLQQCGTVRHRMTGDASSTPS